MFLENGQINKGRLVKPLKWLTEEEFNTIKAKIYWGNTLSECLYCIRGNIWEEPMCPICGKKIKFHKKYQTYCSRKCMLSSTEVIQKRINTKRSYGDEYQKRIQEKIKQTCLRQYGTEYPGQSKEVREKIKQTCLKRYGTESPLNCKTIRNKIEKTNIEKYGSKSPGSSDIVKEKIKQTCLEKYGVENSLSSKEIRRKIKQTCLEKYGVETPMKDEEIKTKARKKFVESFGYTTPFAKQEIRDNIKDKWIKKYGVDNPLKSKEIQNKISITMEDKYGSRDILHTEYGVQKTKETLISKYGVDNISKYRPSREKFEQTMLDKYGTKTYCQSKNYLDNKQRIVNKICNTKKEHNTFHTSKPEDLLYQILKENFNKVERQYKNEKYPWYCDFYIPEIDTYIELQGHFTHGFHPFDKTNTNDINQLEEWKVKGETSKFFRNAIKTWTIKDVEKRNKAKSEKLNYIEIFDIDKDKMIQKLKNEKILK